VGIFALSVSIIAALSAVGVATCVWFAMARVEEDLRTFAGLEGIHFET